MTAGECHGNILISQSVDKWLTVINTCIIQWMLMKLALTNRSLNFKTLKHCVSLNETKHVRVRSSPRDVTSTLIGLNEPGIKTYSGCRSMGFHCWPCWIDFDWCDPVMGDRGVTSSTTEPPKGCKTSEQSGFKPPNRTLKSLKMRFTGCTFRWEGERAWPRIVTKALNECKFKHLLSNPPRWWLNKAFKFQSL